MGEKKLKKKAKQGDSQKGTGKGKKVKKAILGTFLTLLVILLIGIGYYLYYGYQHQEEFFKGSSVNEVDISGMTVEQVEKQLVDSAASYIITVTTKEGESVAIEAADIDYRYDLQDSVKNMHAAQNWWEWGLPYLLPEETSEMTISTVYDAEKLNAIVAGWAFMNKENQVAPVDSVLTYEENQYVVSAHVDGNTIDDTIFNEALNAAIGNGATSLNVEETGAYLLPKVTSDDPVLNDNAKTLNESANCNITYNLPDGSTRVIDKDVLLSWMSTDETGRYYRDDAVFQEKIATVVAEVNEVVASCNGDNVTFTSSNPTDPRQVTVKSYLSGSWSMDVEAETAQLTSEIDSHAVTTREPVYNKRRFAGSGALGSTFVEIDLTAQHLWYYEDGELQLESDFVSGTYTNASRRTPEGIHDIDFKQKNRTLRGRKIQVVTEVQVPVEVTVPGTEAVLDELGNVIQEAVPPTTTVQMQTQQKVEEKYEYESFVKFWMPFNGGIGMHDASWRGSFGGDIYKYSGSHGCINMPTSKAEKLYDMIEKGCVVVCYY